MLSSSMLSQAALSACNFAVGLLLIRRTAHAQYGLYVLIVAGVQLLVQAQQAFIGPVLVRCIAGSELAQRRDFVGGAYREQRRRLMQAALVTAIVLLGLWWFKIVATALVPLWIAAIAAAVCTLYREYFRMVLIAYRLPLQALKADIFYIAVLSIGAFVATLTSAPALVAAMALALAGAVGGWLLSRMVWRHEGWAIKGSPKIVAELAPLGTWALIGAAIHWSFSQGFIYVVAGMLGVTAVATISATRLLLMPINLMSTGMGSMTFPTVSRWLQHHRVGDVFKRLSMLAGGIAGLALLYILVMWIFRDWIFTYVVKGQFAHRDTLILLWSGVFLLMAMRDQMMYLPAARGRFRVMAWLTLATAIFSLTMCYVGIRLFGVPGALLGVLAGEAVNILGFVGLSLREIRVARSEPLPAGAVQ
jgi:O-antigen/teichoic acid export membrane protein